jgi:hypothetical protein
MLPADGAAATGGAGRSDPLLVEPHTEFRPVESDEAADLDIRDTTFGYQSLDMPRCDGQYLGNAVDIEER